MTPDQRTRLRELAEGAKAGAFEENMAYLDATQNPAVVLELLNALEAERARADALTELTKRLDVGRLRKLIRIVTESRRMWMGRALEAERDRDKFRGWLAKSIADVIADKSDAARAIRTLWASRRTWQHMAEYWEARYNASQPGELTEARAWAAWFAAERDWQELDRDHWRDKYCQRASRLRIDAEARVAVLEGVIEQAREAVDGSPKAILRILDQGGPCGAREGLEGA